MRKERPGFPAQKLMSPVPRAGGDSIPPGLTPKEGAVLILLYPKNDELHLVLTKRTDIVAFHKGQISLPGGAREGKESLAETALRETGEEIGIDTSHLEVLGSLTPLYIPVSNYSIITFVALCPTTPRFEKDNSEVEEIIEVPLDVLLNPSTVEEENREIRGIMTRIPFFRVGNNKIWGATAMILSEFIEMVKLLRQK